MAPRTSGFGTGSAREIDAVDPARNARRLGKPLLAAASAAGVLLVGMPLLLVDRGHDDEKQRAQSDIPVGAALDNTDVNVGLDNTDVNAGFVNSDNAGLNSDVNAGLVDTGTATGKHRGPAAKNETTADVSPSALLQQRNTAKHAANSSSAHGILVRGATVAGNEVNSTTVVVQSTRTLSAGESWSATLARMTMRSDGNLVIYDERGHIRWASNTSGAGNRAVFQADGNLVVYNSANQPLWTSGSAGHNGAELVLQADGNVVISQNGTAFWASGTAH